VVITAGYYLWALQRTMFGPMTNKIDTSHLHDVNWYETAPLVILCILIILFGMLPSLGFDFIRTSAGIVSGILGAV
jgi:NADH:ubiquinone oxidoreductase subunit 4 (subunit M)